MVPKKIIGLLCLISVLIPFACKKQKLTGEMEYLVGNWVWHEAEYSVNGGGSTIIETQSSKGTHNTMLIEKKGCITLFENGEKKKKYRIKNIKGYFSEVPNRWDFTLYLSNDVRVLMFYWVNTGRLDVSGFFLIKSDGLTGSNTFNHFYKQP